MRSPLRSPSRRWALPAGVAVVVAGGALVVPQLANANPELPPANAAELLASLSQAQTRPFSGTVVQTTDLGLPKLPQQAAGGEADLATLLAGSTTVRVWSDGPTRSRLALLGTFSETDVVRNGTDVWTWNSTERKATHTTLPTEAQLEAAGLDHDAERPVATATTPQEAAKQALAAVDPSTKVSLAKDTKVAGRDAYELVLQPRTTDTLVGQVRVAVDADTKLPLRVQVFAKGASDPAYETGFTGLSYGDPGDEVFTFTPPKGTKPVEKSLTAQQLAQGADRAEAKREATQRGSARPAGAPSVVGKDWTSVLVLRGVPKSAVTGGQDSAIASSLLNGFRPVSGSFGSGRALQTSLLSALWLDDGRVLVGAVPVTSLEAAATTDSARR